MILFVVVWMLLVKETKANRNELKMQKRGFISEVNNTPTYYGILSLVIHVQPNFISFVTN